MNFDISATLALMELLNRCSYPWSNGTKRKL